MSKLNCETTTFEYSGHIQQILAGCFFIKKTSRGANYLEVQTLFECVEYAEALYINGCKRFEMMKSNSFYYIMYLKLNVLVYNSIIKSLSL